MKGAEAHTRRPCLRRDAPVECRVAYRSGGVLHSCCLSQWGRVAFVLHVYPITEVFHLLRQIFRHNGEQKKHASKPPLAYLRAFVFAERMGFEPMCPEGLTVFKTASL